MPPQRSHSIELEVVGMQFRGWTKQGRMMLQRNTSFAVLLEREPTNEHDPNAILVKIKNMPGIKTRELGYLRKETAEILAPRLDASTLRFNSGICTEVDIDSGRATVVLRFADIKPKVRRKVKA